MFVYPDNRHSYSNAPNVNKNLIQVPPADELSKIILNPTVITKVTQKEDTSLARWLRKKMLAEKRKGAKKKPGDQASSGLVIDTLI